MLINHGFSTSETHKDILKHDHPFTFCLIAPFKQKLDLLDFVQQSVQHDAHVYGILNALHKVLSNKILGSLVSQYINIEGECHKGQPFNSIQKTNLTFFLNGISPPKVNIDLEYEIEPHKIKLKYELPTTTSVKHISKFTMRNKCTLMLSIQFQDETCRNFKYTQDT